MKKVLFIVLFSLAFHYSQAQKSEERVCGKWLGTLNAGGVGLHIGLVVSDSAGVLVSKLLSPDQGVMDIKVDKTEMINDSLKFISKEIRASFKGKINIQNDSLQGYWKQGARLPLAFVRVNELPEFVRPQEPKRPFPYKEEEVTFSNDKAGILFSGTLTLPSSGENFPAVVMVTGSGPQNRDEELLGHKPFLVIADYLTRNGIAVLRYDDRGVGKSKGVFSTATTLDFADDAEAAFEFLRNDKRIDQKKTGLIGHSEGGLIAPIVAARNKNVGFVVMLAGPGLKGEDILLLQAELIARADSTPEQEIETNTAFNKKLYNIAIKEKDDKKAASKMRDLIDEYWKTLNPETIKNIGADKQALVQSVYQLISPWFRCFLTYDPKMALTKTKCSVLAVNGSKDMQVPSQQNITAIKKYLTKAGNKTFVVKEFEGLNHLFQHAETGSPKEYIKIEETCSPEVLEFIVHWIKEIQ